MCMEIAGLCIAYKALPTNVCDLISCPIKVGNHYQITEKIAIAEIEPDVSDIIQIIILILWSHSFHILLLNPTLPLTKLLCVSSSLHKN